MEVPSIWSNLYLSFVAINNFDKFHDEFEMTPKQCHKSSSNANNLFLCSECIFPSQWNRIEFIEFADWFPENKKWKKRIFPNISQKILGCYCYFFLHLYIFSANWLNNRIEIRTHPKRLKCKTNSSSTPLLRFDYFCCCCCG